MEILTTISALDKKLRECRIAQETSDDALRQVFNTFSFDFAAQVPADPFSPDYTAAQMGLYESISGRAYATSNEETVFDVDAALKRPFPYTSSPAIAGAHLSALAFLLRNLDLRPGARVLDVGPGWGNTTLALAQLGFDVTALDIEPRFCALIEARAQALKVPVKVVNDDFFWIERDAKDFDAIIFFECFHHCADHARLLRALPGALAPDGHVYFGAEPISQTFPMPWGVRTDGESLWAIRQNGWLELGFHDRYFRDALRRVGLTPSVFRSLDLPWINVWRATVGQFKPIVVAAGDPRLQSLAGDRHSNLIILDGKPGYGLFGPYLRLPAGHYQARIQFETTPAAGRARFEVAAGSGTVLLSSKDLDLAQLAEAGSQATLPFELDEDRTDLETRLFCEPGCSGAIELVEITEVRPISTPG
jgi:2-polyprenyl-3-methyl-5-hydroxy-6-metoxy-1,4-benzoquinol methylase